MKAISPALYMINLIYWSAALNNAKPSTPWEAVLFVVVILFFFSIGFLLALKEFLKD